MDDITDVVTGGDVVTLLQRTEARSSRSVEWLADNGMVPSLSKSKLLVTCTKELRRAKEVPINLQITVFTPTLRATNSEKLLGMVLNQDFCWDTHMWGDTWRDQDNCPGLVPQKALKSLVAGLFTYKLLF